MGLQPSRDRGAPCRELQDSTLADVQFTEVVKRAAAAAGYDSTRFGGHSLRGGLATTAATAGVDERTIMVRCYMRRGSLFRSIAATKGGL